jgi:hypothetical protein
VGYNSRTMTKPQDDLDAIRQIVAILEDFEDSDRERILRWAREKLGMQQISGLGAGAATTENSATGRGNAAPQQQVQPQPATAPASTASDIRSFIAQKDPKNDTQLSAVVAYYYQFQAPSSERKDAITADDLVDACRKSERRRPARPAQTLVNAYADGVLDKVDRGQYRINSVGENLVAMVLPAAGDSPKAPRRSRPSPGKAAGKKAAGTKGGAKKSKPKVPRKNR